MCRDVQVPRPRRWATNERGGAGTGRRATGWGGWRDAAVPDALVVSSSSSSRLIVSWTSLQRRSFTCCSWLSESTGLPTCEAHVCLPVCLPVCPPVCPPVCLPVRRRRRRRRRACAWRACGVAWSAWRAWRACATHRAAKRSISRNSLRCLRSSFVSFAVCSSAAGGSGVTARGVDRGVEPSEPLDAFGRSSPLLELL